MLDKIRADVVPGEHVSLKGRKDNLKDRPTVARGLKVVEIVVLIFGKLGYHDLRDVYDVCVGFRKIIISFTTLRRNLFLAPDYVCRPHWIPLEIFDPLPINMYLGHPILNLHVFELSKKKFERLREEPRIQLLDRLIIQPPLKLMRFSMNILKESWYADGWKGEVKVKNESGITLGDFVDSLADVDELVKSKIGSTWTISGYLQGYECAALPT